jgi:hypothetical protein
MSGKGNNPVTRLVSQLEKPRYQPSSYQDESSSMRTVGNDRFAQEFFAPKPEPSLYQSQMHQEPSQFERQLESIPYQTYTSQPKSWTDEYTAQQLNIRQPEQWSNEYNQQQVRNVQSYEQIRDEFVNSPRQMSMYSRDTNLVYTQDELKKIGDKLGLDTNVGSTELIEKLQRLTDKPYLLPTNIEEFIAYGRPYSELPASVLNNMAHQLNIDIEFPNEVLFNILYKLDIPPRNLEELRFLGSAVRMYSPEQATKLVRDLAPLDVFTRLDPYDVLEALQKLTLNDLNKDYIIKLVSLPSRIQDIVYDRFQIPKLALNKAEILLRMLNRPIKHNMEIEKDVRYDDDFVTDLLKLTEKDTTELDEMIKYNIPNYRSIRSDVDWDKILNYKLYRRIEEIRYNNKYEEFGNGLFTGRTAEISFKLLHKTSIYETNKLDADVARTMVLEYLQGRDLPNQLTNNYRDVLSNLDGTNEEQFNIALDRYYNLDHNLSLDQRNDITIMLEWARIRGIEIVAGPRLYITKYYPELDPSYYLYKRYNFYGEGYTSDRWTALERKIHHLNSTAPIQPVIDYLNGITDVVPDGLEYFFYSILHDQGIYDYTNYIQNIDRRVTSEKLRNTYQLLIDEDRIKLSLLNIPNTYLNAMSEQELIDLAISKNLIPYGDKERLISRIYLADNFSVPTFQHDPQIDSHLSTLMNNFESNLTERVISDIKKSIEGIIPDYSKFKTDESFYAQAVKLILLKNLQYFGYPNEYRKYSQVDDIRILLPVLQYLHFDNRDLVYLASVGIMKGKIPVYDNMLRSYHQGEVTKEEVPEIVLLDTLTIEQVYNKLINDVYQIDTINISDYNRIMYSIVWLKEKGINTNINIDTTNNRNPLVLSIKQTLNEDAKKWRARGRLTSVSQLVKNLTNFIGNRTVSNEDYNNALDFILNKTNVRPKNFGVSLAIMLRSQVKDIRQVSVSNIQIDKLDDIHHTYTVIEQLINNGFNPYKVQRRFIQQPTRIVHTVTENNIIEFSKSFWSPSGGYVNVLKNPTQKTIIDTIKTLDSYPKLYIPNDFDIWSLEYILESGGTNKYIPKDKTHFKMVLDKLASMQLVKANTNKSRM